MGQLIDKSALVAEIEKRKQELHPTDTHKMQVGEKIDRDVLMWLNALTWVKKVIDTLEVKEVDLDNGIQLTWEDIRELYIIFAEIDVDIEFSKTTNIKPETIGYYQEVLKRFKAYKGEGTNA
jgi:hypothetical protein